MTTNEARQVLHLYHADAQRRDIIGLCARRELMQAHAVLARFAIEVSTRQRRPRTRAAMLETAGFHRQAYAHILESILCK